MKAILSTSMNVLAAVNSDGKLTPCMEVILIFTEPEYTYDAGGLGRRRKVSDFRFAASPEELREIAKSLNGFADDAADRVERAIEDTDAADAGLAPPAEQQ